MKNQFIMWSQIQSEVIEVLRATNDGNDLSERDLALCELAINRKLSPLGVIVFQDLVHRITTYKMEDQDEK